MSNFGHGTRPRHTDVECVTIRGLVQLRRERSKLEASGNNSRSTCRRNREQLRCVDGPCCLRRRKAKVSCSRGGLLSTTRPFGSFPAGFQRRTASASH